MVMGYKAKSIDVDKFLEALEDAKATQYEAESLELAQTKKYYEGVRKGISIAESMFYCSNYEKKGGEG